MLPSTPFHCPRYFNVLAVRHFLAGSFAVRFGDLWSWDHLRSDLGICGPGIICGPIWGSFAALYNALSYIEGGMRTYAKAKFEGWRHEDAELRATWFIAIKLQQDFITTCCWCIITLRQALLQVTTVQAPLLKLCIFVYNTARYGKQATYVLNVLHGSYTFQFTQVYLICLKTLMMTAYWKDAELVL